MLQDNVAEIMVLGIGNLLCADEGFGVRAVEELYRRYRFPSQVHLVDGGTQGIYLVQYIQQARRLLVFDAIDYGLAPGTLKVVYDEEVPRFLGVKKMSLHQTGFQEVLGMAQITGHYPEALVLIGVQPMDLNDYGGSLTDPVKAQIEPAIGLALDYLRQWGVEPEPRAAPLSEEERILTPELEIAVYESGRLPPGGVPI